LVGTDSLFLVVHGFDPRGDCFFLDEHFLFKLCYWLVLYV
jgi:hypothetical protein